MPSCSGATQRTDGFFASAEGGTLFLDEVAELPAGAQSKLLRALATGEVRSLGRSDARRVDVRVVAATHRDLSSESGFRADLLARLAGWTLRVPPLRDRREDVLWLARTFAEARLRPSRWRRARRRRSCSTTSTARRRFGQELGGP
jgi:sigma-54-dependent transcriptional regulator